MPGLSFVEPLSTEWQPASFLKTLDAVRFDERYVRHIHYQEDRRWLATVAYPDYPAQPIETRRFWMYLEGYLYGLSSRQKRDLLTRLATLTFDGDYHALRDALRQLDGAFAAFFLHRATNDWALVNDSLGRLPLYHWTSAHAFYLSRDIRLFTHLPVPPTPDRLGMAQQLMLSYPIGQRTLLDGVKRLPPCTIMRSRRAATPRMIQLYTHNFGERAHADTGLQENARALSDRFESSCTARAQQASTCVVALSGGLDSRAVALGLRRAGHPFETLTFKRPDGSNHRDAEGAKALAKHFGFDAHVLSLPPTTGYQIHQLLQAKGGLDSFDVGFMISFLESVVRRHGPSVHLFTGDVGIALRDLRPTSMLHAEDIMPHILRRCWLSPQRSARLTGIAEQLLLDSIRERLATYPEAAPHDRFKHFLYERTFKFSFEGEDRNRHYCWSTAPLLGTDFVQYALQCPDEQKADFKLYRAFLQTIHPRSLDVGYSDFLGIQMTPLQLRAYHVLRAVVRAVPGLKRFLHRRLGRFRTYTPDDSAIKCMREQIARSTAATEYFDVDAVHTILTHCTHHSRHHIDGLFTVLSLVEDMHGSSTLLKYQTTPLHS